MWYHSYMGSKNWYKWIYLQYRNRLTDIQNKLMVNKEDEGQIRSLGLTDTHYCE